MAAPFDAVPAEATFRTQQDEHATIATSQGDDFRTQDAVEAEVPPAVPQVVPDEQAQPVVDSQPEPEPAPVAPVYTPEPVNNAIANNVAAPVYERVETPANEHKANTPVTLSYLTNLSQPVLPDMTALVAALSTLDGQITSLQEQFNSTQEAIRNHDTEIAQATGQLRTNLRRVTERMDNTIADVARSREALSWAELSQLMEDVMNNPRDIEYVTKLARKARELNKVFQIHQNVLNTMAECNSLLRGLIGDDK